MAERPTYNIILDKGLDYVTPPLLAEAGTLVDTRNYELSAHMGYRRIDGFERRDGLTNGGITRWYRTTLGTVGYPFGDIVVGDLIYKANNVVDYAPIGIVVATGSGNRIDYVPFDGSTRLYTGNTIYFEDTPGVYNPYLIATDSADGRTSVPNPVTYIATTRTYQTTLRNLVQDAPAPVAGTYYSRDRSYEVVNTLYAQISLIGSQLVPGELVLFNGFRYIYAGTSPVPLITNRVYAHLIPTYVADTPVNTNIVGLSSGTTRAALSTATTIDSDLGYLVWCSFPGSYTPRGRNIIPAALHYSFINGSYAASADGPPSGYYYVTTSGGGSLLFEGNITQSNQDSGDWVAGTAVGSADFIITSASGVNQYFNGASLHEIHTAFPTTGSSRIATVNTNSKVAKLAGTGALRNKNTRYQWGTYNFYATVGSEALFGTNGVYRAFYATPEGYSNIYTQADELLDNPKYLTFHAGVQLGLGFAEGSLQLSVGGVPYDFSGLRGALEIGTGDDVTGLLESQDDSTLVFGRRSIRRVTGTTDSTLALATVSANSGAFNYTAANVGTIPVFTGPNGVSTLTQTDAYGDFIGERATSMIYNWLNPKLAPGTGSLELGGVACAIPIRNKNQYRLFLNTGDVVSVLFSTNGTKVMRSDYTPESGATMVPFAWGSSIADDGQEHIEVVWDKQLSAVQDESGTVPPEEDRVYRLDWGWGFDGELFPHYIDVSWSFPTEADSNLTIDSVRLYGAGYGQGSLHVKTSGIEDDFDQEYFERIQDISLPATPVLLRDELSPMTDIIDVANWGLGIKIRITGYDVTGSNVTLTEPSHIVQVLKLQVSNAGTGDK